MFILYQTLYSLFKEIIKGLDCSRSRGEREQYAPPLRQRKESKLEQTSKYRLHLMNQPDPNCASKYNTTNGIADTSVHLSEEICSARCSDIASEQIVDFGRQCLENYEALRLLGKGSFGEVFMVRHRGTGELFSMKIIHKSRIMSQNLIRYALTEKKVMAQTNHPFIVKLITAFQTKERLFLIMDYCPGGDLSQLLQREKKLSEEKAKIYLAEIVLAIEDLHRRNIIFRDLKPDNIVLDKDGHAQLTDFGLSKEGVEGPEDAKSFCGSIAYLAPEILKRSGHGKSVDWYLLGVLLYEMLIGQPPYFSENREELFKNITRGVLKIPVNISCEAKSLIVSLLNRDPHKRLGSGLKDAEDIKRHPFFSGLSWDAVFQKKVKLPTISSIQHSSSGTLHIYESPVISIKKRVDDWTFVSQNLQNDTFKQQ